MKIAGRYTVTAAVAIMLMMVAGADAASAAPYKGYISVGTGRGPTHSGVQGNGWTAVFRESVRGRVRYRVCLTHRDSPRVRRCWNRRTSAKGRSSVFTALFVNDRGGTGRWLARWRVAGKIRASWRFTVRSEGV